MIEIRTGSARCRRCPRAVYPDQVLAMLRPARDGVLAGHVPAKTEWDGVWSDL